MARRRKNPRRRRRARRRNPEMPVVLVNPRGRRRRRRRNPSRRRRARRANPYVKGHYRRRKLRRRRNAVYANPSRRRSRRSRRRRNPSSKKFTDFLTTLGLGALGGGMAYGIDWGVGHMKTSGVWQIAALTGFGILGTAGLSYLADERLAAGLAGGTVALGIGRTVNAIALRKAGPKEATPAAGQTPAQQQALVEEAGRVYRQAYEAGALERMRGANTMARSPYGKSFKDLDDAGAVYREAGASKYIPGPIRYFGPHSWAYRTDAGVVVKYKSAHVG